MEEMIKSMAVTTGLGLPFFTIIYSGNPDLVNSLSNWDIILLGLGFAICKDLVIWGLKE
jgi:hypothetical protein